MGIQGGPNISDEQRALITTEDVTAEQKERLLVVFAAYLWPKAIQEFE